MFKQTANQSTASSGHQQELAPLESGPLQLSSFDPYTHNLEDLELQLSPLFNVTVPNDLSIPQPPPLLPIPHPRPSSPQHVKPEGRRCGRGHLHAPWPRFGRLEIRKCETFCWYCGLTVQSAATLRKHVQNQHQKKGSMQIEVAASTSGRRRQDLTDIIGSHIPTPDRDPPSVTSLGGGITEPQAAQGHSDLACSSLGLSRLQDPMLAPPLVVDDIYPGVLDLSHTDTDSKEKRVFSSNPSPNRGITQRKRPDSPGPPSQHFTYVSKPELQTLQEEARVLRRQKTSMVQFAQQLQSENFALYSQMTGFRRQYYRRQESIHRIFSTLDLSEATRQIVEQSSTFFVQTI
ncbi:hypothetical protein BCR34DRAFT_667782 [Clohesyomyces aquaticus]|uniref:C2H2-type domain-containing protein n=1 Tax=Clohesyomyces aquaticus TaxID=1231657 RepID=A0A1Y1YVI0_9PLEO|nr:hypothetical protein BCR34DRAFT_667782 [Clohesyomyces aquaticus]